MADQDAENDLDADDDLDSENSGEEPGELDARLMQYLHLMPAMASHLPPLPEVSWPPLDAAAALDRAQGCLLGLAIGEALGSAVEFLPRGGFPEITEMSGGGPLQLAPGEWTDGTAMAICLAQSILHTDTVDQYDFMGRLGRWLTRGKNAASGQCVGIGQATRTAIERFLREDEAAAGSADEATAGNGSLIRLAPLAIRWADDSELARFLAPKQSRTTHGTIECLDACELFTAQLVDALRGADKAAATRPRIMQLTLNALAINGGEWKQKSRDQIRSSAYVIDTLEAGLWAVWNSDSFQSAVLLAANLGNDAAGVAAVAGQLAGAHYGAASIPAQWRATLVQREKIERLATDLCAPVAAAT